MIMINYIYLVSHEKVEKTMNSKPWDQNHEFKIMNPKKGVDYSKVSQSHYFILFCFVIWFYYDQKKV